MPDIVRNGDLTYKQRIDLIKRSLLINGIDLIDEKALDNSFYQFNIAIAGKPLSLNILPKNIVNSGWSDKPLIKRIQVQSFTMNEIDFNTSNTCSMFVGFAYANESPVFVVWNPFMFVYHKTVRSCYVDVELIARCRHEGFIKTVSSKQKVLLSDTENFGKMVLKYLEDNRIEKI